ncbi:MAG: hypothetical protein M3513_13935 [Actinomycetota bacterium]|nr:hypothetical protein [Actinomycetota bacterium]
MFELQAGAPRGLGDKQDLDLAGVVRVSFEWARARPTYQQPHPRGLDERFVCQLTGDGPLLFPDLNGVHDIDERTAIDAGHIRPTATKYVGPLA